MRDTLEKVFGARWFGPGAPFGSRVPDIDHPVFGNLIFNQGAKGPYWIHETYDDDELCIAIDTIDVSPPSKEQENFYLEVKGSIDRYFDLCRPIIVPEYKRWFDKEFPSSWSKAFKLASLNIPLNGERKRDWEITFECITESTGFLFTCYFVKGEPSGITVDT